MSIKINFDGPSFILIFLLFIAGIWQTTAVLKDKLTDWADRQPHVKIIDPNNI